MSKNALFPVEVLSYAIVEVRRKADNRIFNFRNEMSKVVLRHLLLSMHPFLIAKLYEAYQLVEAVVKERIESKLQDDLKKLNKDFLESLGSSSVS